MASKLKRHYVQMWSGAFMPKAVCGARTVRSLVTDEPDNATCSHCRAWIIRAKDASEWIARTKLLAGDGPLTKPPKAED